VLASVMPEATGIAKIPPGNCRTCHEPPKATVEYRGLRVNHEEYLSYGAGCESCHRGVTSQPKPMDNGECFSCHDFGMERMTTVADMHRVHSGGAHKVECFSCHGVIRHGPSAQSMRLEQIDCQACHQKQHSIQRETYKSTTQVVHVAADGSAVTPMFLAHVDCTGCHVQPRPVRSKPESGARVAAAGPKSCDPCHKPGLGDQMVPLWQKNTRQLYDSVAQLMVSQPTPAKSAEAQKLTTEAQRLLEVVRLDGSWGVHNPRYTQFLLEQAKAKLVQAAALEAARKEGGPP